jgi:type III pantothenate kinase
MTSLAPDDPTAWDVAIDLSRDAAVRWAVAGVHPVRCQRFREWAARRGDEVVSIASYRQVPLRVDVDEPEQVGIDRVLGAVAARSLTPAGEAAITVDVGTAVTVNLIDASGTFRGGAIFPGPQLMARSLHRDTAALPPVDLAEVPAAAPPGRNTTDAIRSGIAAAVMGGVGLLVTRVAAHHPWPWLFLTGGGRGCLSRYGFTGVSEVHEVPHLTLEGIRLAAEALP